MNDGESYKQVPRVAAKRTLARSLYFLLAVLAVYSLFFHRLAERDLWSSHEARAGMDAQTMLEGEWSLPHLYDGRAELQKPPLYYWLVAAIARLRGGVVDALAVRLPAAAAALLSVLAVAVGLTYAGRRRAGLLAAAVLATAVHFTWLARIGRIDMPLTLAVTLAIGAFFLALRRAATVREREFSAPLRSWLSVRERRTLLALGYIAIAAGVMLKGPIGFLLPATVMVAWITCECGAPWRERGRAWRRALAALGIWWGLPLVAVLTVPWFLWADAATHGEFFRVFFWHHNIERGWGGSDLRSNPWWFYGPQFIADFLPWSPLIPLACWWFLRRYGWRMDAEARFGLIWFVSVFLLLSCSRFKRADYLLPAYPGAALFLGCVGQHWLEGRTRQRRRIAASCAATLAGLMVVLWLFRVEWQLPAHEAYRDYRPFATRVRALAPPPEEVVFFRTEAHPLAFHVGRPLSIVVQWEELNARLLRPGTHYFVTPPRYAEECLHNLRGVRLERIVNNTELCGGKHERPLVLLRALDCGGAAAR